MNSYNKLRVIEYHYSQAINKMNQLDLLKIIVTKESWDELYLEITKKRYLTLINN